MQLSGFWPVFLAGCFGGALAELMKWYGLRECPNLPTYATSVRYWAITATMVICGGLLATLYGTQNVMAMLGVNIGISAPLIMASLAKTVPTSTGDITRGAQKTVRPTILDFLAGR